MSKVIYVNKKTRSLISKIISFLCLIYPIAAAFLGYFITSPIWQKLFETDTPETAKFGVSVFFFLVASLIVFFKTRNANPIIQIRVSDEEIKDSDF